MSCKRKKGRVQLKPIPTYQENSHCISHAHATSTRQFRKIVFSLSVCVHSFPCSQRLRNTHPSSIKPSANHPSLVSRLSPPTTTPTQPERKQTTIFPIPSTPSFLSRLVLRVRCLPIRLSNGRGNHIASLEIIGPALLLRPQLRIVGLGVDFELLEVGIDDFFSAVGALYLWERKSRCQPILSCVYFMFGGRADREGWGGNG